MRLKPVAQPCRLARGRPLQTSDDGRVAYSEVPLGLQYLPDALVRLDSTMRGGNQDSPAVLRLARIHG